MTNDPLVYALDRAQNLIDDLGIIWDMVGQLDDYFETEYIDNRFRDNLGAYQHIQYALSQLQNFAWELQETIANEVDSND